MSIGQKIHTFFWYFSCIIGDFAIRNLQRIPVPAFGKERASFFNFFVGTETFFCFCRGRLRPGKNKQTSFSSVQKN